MYICGDFRTSHNQKESFATEQFTTLRRNTQDQVHHAVLSVVYVHLREQLAHVEYRTVVLSELRIVHANLLNEIHSRGMSDREPKLCELEYLQNSNGTLSVKIIDRVQGRWQALIGFFCLPPHTKEAILGMQGFNAENACREVFRRWLNGGDELLSPKDWNMVIEVLCRIGKLAVAEELRSILTDTSADSKAMTNGTHSNVSL